MGSSNKRIDLTNQKFGEWTALYSTNNGYWYCRCSCGLEREVLGRSLRTGKSTSCGHLQKKDSIQSGDTFGEWEVLEYLGYGEYKCRCSCGVEKKVKTIHLLSGSSKSCGHATTKFKDLTGQTFGSWQVIKYKGDQKWECKCECGKIKDVKTSSLLNKTSTNCGCKNSVDLTGQQFGELTVIQKFDRSRYLCKCSCGNTTIVYGATTIRECKVKSCGCKTVEFKRNTMIERYGDTAASRIGNPRDTEIQEACQDRQKMIELIT